MDAGRPPFSRTDVAFGGLAPDCSGGTVIYGLGADPATS